MRTTNGQELKRIMDSYHLGGYGEEYEEILAWHTRKLNEARIDEIRRTRPHLTYPGMVYYGERMNELRGAETEEVK